ncbi:hypothetical protein DICVIV_08658 [Dictyocaulus viviparus]|uniref:Uncharacterized protein n=1 Tax=Dictyocaulus viviparus TaxID=29172 RepID=A0A0D8XNH1_DICVI|nr:hypothetical protein DICVIV_08658 [Dictyocaulus viviparus]
MKECNVVDTEFNTYFNSRYSKRVLRRTLVGESVKEFIYDTSLKYLDFVIKKENLPENLFCQQYKVGFNPKLALLPTEVRDDESILEKISTIDFTPNKCTAKSAMVLNDNCEKSRECSPIHTSQPSISNPIRSDAVLVEAISRSSKFAPHTSRKGNNLLQKVACISPALRRAKRTTTSTRKRAKNNRKRVSSSFIENKKGKKINLAFLRNVPIVLSWSRSSLNRCILHDIPNGFWNESASAVLNSYFAISSQITGKVTFMGFDIEQLRNEIHDEQETTLSVFLNCTNECQIACCDNSMVDSGLKEDRRIMAAAKSRNNRLLRGYFA